VGIILLLLLPGFARAFWAFAVALARTGPLLRALAVGFLVGVAVERIALRRVPVVGIFEHELTHALAALLLLRRVKRLVVDGRRGGYVESSGGFGGLAGEDFVGLAPYFMPTFSVFLVALRPLLFQGPVLWFDLLVGFTLGFHTSSTIAETRESWTRRVFFVGGSMKPTKTDIARRGFLYSSLFIAALGMAVHGLLLAILAFGYRGVPMWAALVGGTFLAGLQEVGDLVRRLLVIL
jgi:hypothetical protein